LEQLQLLLLLLSSTFALAFALLLLGVLDVAELDSGIVHPPIAGQKCSSPIFSLLLSSLDSLQLPKPSLFLSPGFPFSNISFPPLLQLMELNLGDGLRLRAWASRFVFSRFGVSGFRSNCKI